MLLNAIKPRKQYICFYIKTDTIKAENNLYRIEIHSSMGAWLRGNHKVAVISNPENQLYASFSPLFALDSQDKISASTETRYFIVKQTTAITGKSSTSQSYKCSFSEAVDEGSYEECQINLFSSDTTKTKLNELPFQNPTWSNTNIENGKFYLVKLNNPVSALIKSLKIKKNDSAISLESKIVPAIYHNKKGDNIFMLEVS